VFNRDVQHLHGAVAEEQLGWLMMVVGVLLAGEVEAGAVVAAGLDAERVRVYGMLRLPQLLVQFLPRPVVVAVAAGGAALPGMSTSSVATTAASATTVLLAITTFIFMCMCLRIWI
jgi:hypothetical protein